MTSTGEEKKQSSNKNSIVMLIIVAVFSMAVGAAGGILVYRETCKSCNALQWTLHNTDGL